MIMNFGRTLMNGTTHHSCQSSDGGKVCYRNFGTSTQRRTETSTMGFMHHNKYIMGLKNIVNGLISPANNFDLCSRDLQRRKLMCNTMAGIANEVMPIRPQAEGRLKTAILGLDLCNSAQSPMNGLIDQCLDNKCAEVVAVDSSEEFPDLHEVGISQCQPKQSANCSNTGNKVEALKSMNCSKQDTECDSEDSFVVFAPSSSKQCYMPKICNRLRQRQISECSDDSFVICFTEDAPEGVLDVVSADDESETESDSDTDSVSDDDYEDDDLEEENQDKIDGIPHFVQKTERCFLNSGESSQPDSGFEEHKQSKRVRFNLKPEVHVMHVWNFAYKACRKGHWDIYARDRDRFERRVKSLAEVLNPVLDSKHRERIYQTRFCDKTNLNQLETKLKKKLETK